MNPRKHIQGFAVFLIILSSAVFINEYLTQGWKVPKVRVLAPISKETTGRQQPFNFNVRQVSLDFINGKSHTTLTLKREAGQFAPEKLWVTTFFFSPEYPERGSWTSRREIRHPFADDDQVEVNATSDCESCVPFDTPKSGYFARVYVSTKDDDDSYPPDEQSSRDITTAVPVVVHWPDVTKQPGITSKATTVDKINFSNR